MIKKFSTYFEFLKNKPCDINEHLETLRNYGEKCDHITEFGFRKGISTIAFLFSEPKKIITYDIINCDTQIIKKLNVNNHTIFKFIKNDVLKIEIEKTDLLFIDTLHTYNQLIQELTLHAINVSKYIILHDTCTFGRKDETIYAHASNIVKSENTKNKKSGLICAIIEFLQSEEGKNWKIEKIYTNNNGLTILRRIK